MACHQILGAGHYRSHQVSDIAFQDAIYQIDRMQARVIGSRNKTHLPLFLLPFVFLARNCFVFAAASTRLFPED